MSQTGSFLQLIQALTPRYGEGEAHSIARIVLEDAFGTRHYAQFEPANDAQRAEWARITAALVDGQPVQYVLGTADFFGLKFKVSPAVLIPRQETEEVVDTGVQFLKKRAHAAPVILDIGVGSGCIGITLLHKWPGATLIGIEKSPDALEIAQYNAQKLLKKPERARFLLADILADALGELPVFDLIISNPPYIPRHEAAVMPEHVLAHEPELALFVDDDDALLFYRKIATFAQQHLAPDGMLCFECNEFNAPEVLALLNAAGFRHTQLLKDLNGADRIATGICPD